MKMLVNKTKFIGVSRRQRTTPINNEITNFPIDEYNKAIQDINAGNFSDYCSTYFDRAQLSNIDWSVHYDEKGSVNLLWCEEFVKGLEKEQAIKVIDFLNEKKLQHKF